MMEFLNTLFWLPLNSFYVVLNVGLWGLFIWLGIEGFKHLKDRYYAD